MIVSILAGALRHAATVETVLVGRIWGLCIKMFRPPAMIVRTWSVARQQGLAGFLHSAMEHVRERLGFPSSARHAYRTYKSRVDATFDAENGIETGGVQYIAGLTIKGENVELGTNHIASDPAEFEAAMSAIEIDFASATFLDFGAGKARALILAAAYPFRAIIGVEFAVELWEAGNSNLNKIAARLSKPERIELLLADATEYDLPASPLVIYLYNPFGAPIVAAVARKAMASWQSQPRPMRVAYLNPLHLDEWTNAGWHLIDRQKGHAILAPAVFAGSAGPSDVSGISGPT